MTLFFLKNQFIWSIRKKFLVDRYDNQTNPIVEYGDIIQMEMSLFVFVATTRNPRRCFYSLSRTFSWFGDIWLLHSRLKIYFCAIQDNPEMIDGPGTRYKIFGVAICPKIGRVNSYTHAKPNVKTDGKRCSSSFPVPRRKPGVWRPETIIVNETRWVVLGTTESYTGNNTTWLL